MNHDFFSLFRHFNKEFHKGNLTKEQLVEKWRYSQQISGIKPVDMRKENENTMYRPRHVCWG